LPAIECLPRRMIPKNGNRFSDQIKRSQARGQ
jgi:hypothetical protein